MDKNHNHPMFDRKNGKRIFEIQNEFTELELKFIRNAVNRLSGHVEQLDLDDVPLISLEWLRKFMNANQGEFFEPGQYLCLIISSKTKI